MNAPSAILRWVTVGASVPGSRHRLLEEDKQDAMRVNLADDHLAIAAADGAGSAPRSAQGADVAASQFSSAMRRWKDTRPMTEKVSHQQVSQAVADAFANAAEQVKRTAQSQRRELRDYHTTLVALACAGDHGAVRHTGDGGVITLDRLGRLHLVSPPQRGQYVNETRFITMPGAPAQGQPAELEVANLAALVIFTDGMETLLLDREQRPSCRSAGSLIRWAQRWVTEERDPQQAADGLREYLLSDEIARKTDDDLTVCIAIPLRRCR